MRIEGGLISEDGKCGPLANLARVYRCDRCGKYISPSVKDFFVRKPTKGVYRFGKKAHLCGKCKESFCQWFFEPKVKVENDDV